MEALKTAASITTPIACVAFVAALAMLVYFRYLKSQEKKLAAVPVNKRGQVVLDNLYERLGLKLDNLTREQKIQFVTYMMDRKASFARFLIATLSIVFIICFSIAAAVAWTRPQDPNTAELKTQVDVLRADADKSREIIKNCTENITKELVTLNVKLGKLPPESHTAEDKEVINRANAALLKAKRGYMLTISNTPQSFKFS